MTTDVSNQPTALARRLALMLLLLRLSVFLVFLVWALDKFLNPEHTAAVFDGSYGISNLVPIASYILGALQLAISIGFVLGIAKFFTYGMILVMHAVSTFASFPYYLDPYASPNLLFFTAWPMLAACCALFVLRKEDTIALSFGSKQPPNVPE
ncbi:hypothetical protein KR51_00034380 [Rubidibacter lacunae KORDI 51-2]|uniref:DoxX n=2 Tax=Rubidibacter TaxID=582491 RepID=U5D687_9CHRO|nr:hypothetical protein KR51_00034380 [Rubidibacter lacunae KORDI 51-2]